jgi:hypothetical protein
MWVKRSEYRQLVQDTAAALGARDAMQRQVDTQKTNQDWMVLRLTQLEHERAQLLYRYMDIKITVPTVELDNPVVPHTDTNRLSDIPSFEDVGDEEAKKLGLDWDSDGRLTHHGKAAN